MKTALTGSIGSLVALSCITVFAGVNSDAAKYTETLDKLKVIETINVTSSKEIDETKSDKIDGEVLKILKAADHNEQGLNSKTKSASDKLKVIETINVTSPKEIDETKRDKIDVEVSKILKAADQNEQWLKSKTKSTSDKLKIIETINVTSSKEIDDTNNDEVHGEVLEILEQVDQEYDEAAAAESTYGKLKVSGTSKTVNVTVFKGDDGVIEDIEVEVEAEHEIEWVQEGDEPYDTATQIRDLKRSGEIDSEKFKHGDDETETK